MGWREAGERTSGADGMWRGSVRVRNARERASGVVRIKKRNAEGATLERDGMSQIDW